MIFENIEAINENLINVWTKNTSTKLDIDLSSVLDDAVVIHCDHCEHHDDECQWFKKLKCETQDDCFCSWAVRRQDD